MIKIFISYSTGDNDLVKQVANYIEPHCEVYYWNQNRTLGEPLWSEIYKWIDDCNLFIAVITDKTVGRAMSVGQEIGRAIAKGKTVIPLVGKEVADSELGCLRGLNYQRISNENFGPAMEAIRQRILALSFKEDIKQIFIVSALAIAAVWAFSPDSK
jgi:hypothetical protein